MKERIVGAFLFVAMHGVSVAALGQTSEAQRLFEQAVEEHGRKNFAAACPNFEKSFNLDKNAGTLFSLANCLKDAGKFASAFVRFGQFINAYSKLDDNTRAQRKGFRQQAVNALKTLTEQVPRLKLKMPSGAPEGLVVSLDSAELAPSTVEQVRMLDPGTYKLAVDVPGRQRVEWEVLLEEGQTLEKEIPIPPHVVPARVPVKPKTIAMPNAAQTQWTGRTVAMFTGGSVAIAGLIAGGIPFGIALSKKSDVEAHCPNKACDTPEWTQQAQEAQALAKISVIGAVLGGAGAVALAVSGLANGKSNDAKPRVEAGILKLDSTGAMFGLKGAF